jgi:monofunctional biosynthetic peptidoglycan transglycosylase
MAGFPIVFFSRYLRKRELARKSKNRKRLFLVALILLFGFTLYLFSIPDVSKLKRETPRKTSFMKYREREWTRAGKPYKIQQRWVPLSQISPYLVKAVLIAEDDKFWHHEGFDYEAIRKALEKDIREKKFKLGGSTITQQLAKNLYLSPVKSPLRKMREAIIAWRIERNISKERILELYLNVVEWGDYGIFGIEAASRHYYRKSASALNAQEASRLAAILPNPRKYDPLMSSRYVLQRAQLIHGIMVKRGIVPPEIKDMTEEE